MAQEKHIGSFNHRSTSRRAFIQAAGAITGGLASSFVPGCFAFGAAAGSVGGETAKGFEKVREAFAANVSEVGPGGASFAAYLKGKKVVDLWAGMQGPGVPWTRNTMACYYSSTKIAPGLVAMRLVDQGKLQLDVPVAKYWPEFAQKGKSAITVRQVLAMEGGIPYVPGYEDFMVPNGGGWDNIEEIEKRLAGTAPIVEPGTPAYPAQCFGYLVNGFVRRIDGREVKTIFNDDIAKPLKVDLWMGPPEDVIRRHYATLYTDRPPQPGATAAVSSPLRDKVFHIVNGRTILQDLAPWGMNPVFLRSGAGVGEMVGTAEGLAKLYVMILNGGTLDGVKILSPEVLKTFLTVQSPNKLELIFNRKSVWMLGGFQANMVQGVEVPGNQNNSLTYGPGKKTFGKNGAGGQNGFADPEAGLTIAFLRSELTFASPLQKKLIDATYASLG